MQRTLFTELYSNFHLKFTFKMCVILLSYCMAKPSNSFFGDFELSPFFRLYGPGKWKNTLTFHEKLFFQDCEW